MRKLVSKKHPIVIGNKYNKSINNSTCKKLIASYFRTTLGVSSLMYQGFKIWNEIPLQLKNLESTKLFQGFKIWNEIPLQLKNLESTKLFSRKYKEHLLKSVSM